MSSLFVQPDGCLCSSRPPALYRSDLRRPFLPSVADLRCGVIDARQQFLMATALTDTCLYTWPIQAHLARSKPHTSTERSSFQRTVISGDSTRRLRPALQTTGNHYHNRRSSEVMVIHSLVNRNSRSCQSKGGGHDGACLQERVRVNNKYSKMSKDRHKRDTELQAQNMATATRRLQHKRTQKQEDEAMNTKKLFCIFLHACLQQETKTQGGYICRTATMQNKCNQEGNVF